MRYSQGFKRSTVRKLLQTNPPTLQELSGDTGDSQQTLYNSLLLLKEDVEMSDYKRTPEEWSLSAKQEVSYSISNRIPGYRYTTCFIRFAVNVLLIFLRSLKQI